MKDQLFAKLWKDALRQPSKELYISEYGYPDWFDEISTDANSVVERLGQIHDTAHITVKNILQRAGLTQSAFATRFCIPLRTVEDWCTEKRKCPDYERLSFCRELGFPGLQREGVNE